MRDNMKACGKTTKCMEEESSHGLTEENTKASTIWIRNKGGEPSHGQMGGNITVNGEMESNKAKVSIETKMVSLRKGYGKMVKK